MPLQSSNIAQVGRLIGQKWRELTEEEKQPYVDEYETEKVRYTEQMKIYRSSPAYKRWLELKQQGLGLFSISLTLFHQLVPLYS